ncbi:polysaccharide pyruvyl transferase CsaB [Deinococcus yavapaiensis]|uniref:Polysaccharide pyruvyl transferase CsaB n=1 Tax=Deinococcus yavapaiensis KR-236 TaxID=694435 RepID=A0A318SCX2_9DEIO|nr:polysaccharide pyruvyl transferase CsaB [Deinococcus yavapaiensis]PYE54208.1 polysaccharide pyruvyl transferase CsaB [Deinococcus yavapaiensis KR-236]
MKILVSGYYGFANTGDEALALAISRELRARGHEVDLLSATPNDTARTYGVRSSARMHPLELLKAVTWCDVLLSGGGGLLQDKTSGRTLAYYLAVIRLGKLFRKRVVVFNQSVGPLSESGGRQVKAALRGVPAIVRDAGSVRTLEALGISASLGGDPALLLSAGDVKRDENRVILAPRGGERGATTRLAVLARELRAEGREVVALSFMPSQDDEECRLIGGEIVSTDDPRVALDTIAGAGYVIGVRLHAVILAAAAGVGFAGVSYDPKVAGFCADAGAFHVGTEFDGAAMLRTVRERTSPNWESVAAMKNRAKSSFDFALKR